MLGLDPKDFKGGYMRGFDPKDFPDYHTYEINRNKLERAQRVANRLFDLWNDSTGIFQPHTGYWYEAIGSIEDAVQIGYEEAIGLPHKSSDYDVDEVTVGDYADRCKFCKHVYYVYGCEENCALKTKGLECNFEVKEFLE
ncbi:MAG: hypothetical protein PHX61_12545 [Alphaproteobacteria bacterium]|nr:hypothetical protein [Alphaproteobacteria bacterium]